MSDIESRLDRVENEVVLLSKSINDLYLATESLKTVSENMTSLTREMTTLNSTLTVHIKDEENLEESIKKIDSTLTGIKDELYKMPVTTTEKINSSIGGVYERSRVLEQDLLNFKVTAEKEHAQIEEKIKVALRNEAKSHLVLVYIILAMGGSIFGFLYESVTTQIKTNTVKIDNHMRDYSLHKVNKLSKAR